MEADFVIVGAGSAGCAMAFRLSESGASVLIVEYGGTDWGPFIQMPTALSYPMNMSRYNWGFLTEPEPNLNNRRLVCPRGKVIGGSSSINGMVYVRGHPFDYEHWSESGASGWAFADVLPYFKRMECWHHNHDQDDHKWRGKSGPLHITRGFQSNPLHKALITAGQQAGYQTTQDYNGEKQEGFGAFEQTIWKGRRWSTANAYLKPALKGPNVKLVRGLVERIILSEKRAVGIELSGNKIIHARREVILAASVVNSPKLLMLSGIGPAAQLAKLGIPIIANRPAVGSNLQDHLELYVQYSCSQPITLFRYWNLASKVAIGTQWMFTKKGLGASNQLETGGFIRSRAGIEYPDLQIHFLPIAIRYDGKMTAKKHGFQIHVGPMRSKSRGQVTLESSNPRKPPKIFFNYMSHSEDWEDFRRAIRLTREIFSQNAFLPFVNEELMPGKDVQNDVQLDSIIREHVESAYHPCGTCRMGAVDDKKAVVDPTGKVIGVSNLRVADSSIFPRITNGNINAPSIMVAEKISDHILGKNPLPPEEKSFWIHPKWQILQR